MKIDEHTITPKDFDGIYLFHEKIGCGSFGKVYLATHLLTNVKVAVKIVDKVKHEVFCLTSLTSSVVFVFC